MGCNCKSGKPQVLNNLNSVDHIMFAEEVYKNVIQGKSSNDYDDFDKNQILGAYKTLYPNAKMTPSIDNAISNIKLAIENYTHRK